MSKLITIIGFGSLLSKKSSKITCPKLRNFRKIRVNGYQRIFNLASPTAINFINNNAINISACSTIKKDNSGFLAIAFDITEDQWENFANRESGYQLLPVEFTNEENNTDTGILCVNFNNNHLENHHTSKDLLIKLRGELNYTADIIRNDILPWEIYLDYCINSAKKLGEDYLNSFLDESFLADETTTIREYLKANPNALKNLPKHNIKNYQ